MSALPRALRCKRAPNLWQSLRNLYYGVDRGKSTRGYLDRVEMPILAIVGANGGGKSWAAVYTVAGTLLEERPWRCTEATHRHMHGEHCPTRAHGGRLADCTCWRYEQPPAADHESAGGFFQANERAEPRVVYAGTTSGVRTVLSTIDLLDPDTGKPHPRATLLTSYQQLRDAEHCDVLLDEATGVADSQDHAGLPAPVRNILAQQRKRDCRIIWTSPDYSNANNRLRQVTQGVVWASGGSKVQARDDTGRVWNEARRFRWTLYSTEDFENFTASQRMTGKPLSAQVVWRPGHIVDRMYNTLSVAQMLGVATEGGSCLGCGGSRSKPKCSCDTDGEALPPGVVEEVKPSGARHRRLVPPPPPPAAPDLHELPHEPQPSV